jgi:hypothetical protein
MNIRVHMKDFSVEDFVDVKQIREDYDGDFVIEVKDSFSYDGTRERYILCRDVTSVEIRP